MATLGYLQQLDNGNFEGFFETLSIPRTEIAVVKIDKNGENAPDYRVVLKNRPSYEIGAAWIKRSKTSGNEYVSVTLSEPGFGTLYCNLGRAAGQDDESTFAMIWNDPTSRQNAA